VDKKILALVIAVVVVCAIALSAVALSLVPFHALPKEKAALCKISLRRVQVAEGLLNHFGQRWVYVH
jgi:hypothetical protein